MEASRKSNPRGWPQDVPHSSLQNLRCDICHKYLSVFPVYMSPFLGTTCGRCPIDEDLRQRDALRNTTYEKAVELSRFPCCNDEFGCDEKLTPSSISAHEKICKFRQVNCPCIQAECDWKGPRTSLVDHFEDKHSNFLSEQPTFVVNYAPKKVYMLVLEEGIFLFHREYDVYSKKFRYSVEYFGLDEKPADFSYQITLRSGILKFPQQSAIKLDENTTEIDAVYVGNRLNNPPCILGIIEITRNNVTDQNDDVKEKLSKQMLKILECPVCLQYMTAPIFQCRSGHSFCGFCKSKISPACPICKQPVQNTRNFGMESMTNLVLHSCENADKGCDFLIDGSKIREHEKYCQFRTVQCPFSICQTCDYECELKSMMNHILDRHKDNILERGESGDIHNPKPLDCYVLKYADKIFIVHVRAQNYSYKWSLQFLGSFNESVKCFKLEIDVLDNTKNGQRIYLREACSEFTGAGQTFEDDSDYLSVNRRQGRRMMTDTCTYRMRMIKDVV